MRTVFFDLETGGLDPSKHPIIQIAAIAVDENLRELDTFEEKIKFDLAKADPEALAKNCYDAATWERDASSGLIVVNRFSKFLKQFADVELISQRTNRPYCVAQLIGHNAATFDGPFLQAFYREHDAFLPGTFFVMDTCQRAKWHFHEHRDSPPPADFKLGTLCAHFGIELTEAHDALADVRATVELYRHLVNCSAKAAA